jgi:hypothetical protein
VAQAAMECAQGRLSRAGTVFFFALVKNFPTIEPFRSMEYYSLEGKLEMRRGSMSRRTAPL